MCTVILFQIRRIIGAGIAALRGILSPADVKHMLENPYSWMSKVQPASPYGLHLIDIEFDPADLVGASRDLWENPLPPIKEPPHNHTPIEIDW